MNTLVTDAVKNKYYYSYPNTVNSKLCAYCISPFVRGLYELYLITKDENHLNLLKSSIDWIYGNNTANTVLFDKQTGVCLDGIDNNIVSEDAGAESSIEAGFIEIRRMLLNKSRFLGSVRKHYHKS